VKWDINCEWWIYTRKKIK